MYLGGNSDVRRRERRSGQAAPCSRSGAGAPAGRTRCRPAERHHCMTGEQGGTWRNRGRGPHALVGLGTAGAGFDRGSPYRRQPDSHDPRVGIHLRGHRRRPDRRRAEPPGALGRRRLRVRPGRLRSWARRRPRCAWRRRCGSTPRTSRWSTMRCTSLQGRDGAHVGDRAGPRARRTGSPGPTWRISSTRTAAPSSRPVRSAGAAACPPTTTTGPCRA